MTRGGGKIACAFALVFVSIALSGCGGGGGGGSTTTTTTLPPACSPAGHCSHCDLSTMTCTACVDGYDLDDKKECIASCVLKNHTKPPLPPPGVYNGYSWPMECIHDEGEHHFFAIGDWGGVHPGVPAPNTGNQGRPSVDEIDNHAQALVAGRMNERAKKSKPDFVLNVGDNFYWGGIPVTCGTASKNMAMACSDPTFESTFENIYKGEGMDNVPWFSVLGNHDWGGVGYQDGWDLQIYRSFCPKSRFRMPGLWWHQKVQYRDFAIDFFMLDSNTHDSTATAGHQICEEMKGTQPGCSVPNATMKDAKDCVRVLNSFWTKGIAWLRKQLAASTAEWQVVVTHFPPIYQAPTWQTLVKHSGVDLIVAGHVHEQDLHLPNDKDPRTAALAGAFDATWIITGGGGGITSEHMPNLNGWDNAYGFVDFTITKDQMKIEMVSHGGLHHLPLVRRTETIKPRDKKKKKFTNGFVGAETENTWWV